MDRLDTASAHPANADQPDARPAASAASAPPGPEVDRRADLPPERAALAQAGAGAGRPCRWRADGMVSAETAVALPALIVVLGLLLWAVGVGVTHARCVGAARGAALAAARGEADDDISGRVRASLGEHSRVSVRRTGADIRIVVTTRVGGGRLLPARTVTASAYAVAEPGQAGPTVVDSPREPR